MSDKVTKLIDSISELTVLELAELVKALEEKFGVTAAAPVAAVAVSAGAAADGEAVEEQSAFNVILANAGGNKIAVIKALREINPQLGLKEAKDLSEKPGAEILSGVNKATAEEAKAKLTTAGATVELK
ncbi:MAG: 50S ribosomal protein L7/L12 [bacterium]|nr:50S ribosomal protein L7/L12 [bacterium]